MNNTVKKLKFCIKYYINETVNIDQYNKIQSLKFSN